MCYCTRVDSFVKHESSSQLISRNLFILKEERCKRQRKKELNLKKKKYVRIKEANPLKTLCCSAFAVHSKDRSSHFRKEYTLDCVCMYMGEERAF